MDTPAYSATSYRREGVPVVSGLKGRAEGMNTKCILRFLQPKCFCGHITGTMFSVTQNSFLPTKKADSFVLISELMGPEKTLETCQLDIGHAAGSLSNLSLWPD